MTEGGNTDEYDHVDDSREAHGECTDEERLRWMANHLHPDLGPEDVAHNCDDSEEGEQSHVAAEDSNRDPI